jgi:hypothetical protein
MYVCVAEVIYSKDDSKEKIMKFYEKCFFSENPI